MNEERKEQNRVLGYVLSQEETAMVSGGGDDGDTSAPPEGTTSAPTPTTTLPPITTSPDGDGVGTNSQGETVQSHF